MIDEIIRDENVHVKFVDALLNLIARVINLQVTEEKKLCLNIRLRFHNSTFSFCK